MPEGPELHLNSRFVNHVSKRREFGGSVVKSDVSKSCDVPFTSPRYTISSQARGKEMTVTLQCLVDPKNRTRILFRFGMSGRFRFGSIADVPKHSHLKFFSTEHPQNVLSFVDVRRFGSWQILPEGWGEERGPDPMYEYEAFRRNVLENLEDSAFNRPICEALLNQRFFNGVGNYLRAEILFRAGVAPFTCAREVLEPLRDAGSLPSSSPDLLQLCYNVPLEVVNLKAGFGATIGSPVSEVHYREFMGWLQCYENPDMRTLRDHNNRTIWFQGEAGPMAPKGQKSRAVRRRRSVDPVKVMVKEEEEEDGESVLDWSSKTAEGPALPESKDELKVGELREAAKKKKKTRKRPRGSSSEKQGSQKRQKTSNDNSVEPTNRSVSLRRSARIKALQSTRK